MTRDEEVRERTVKRFLECEAKRAEARAAALAEGKSEDEAGEIAHVEARKHWNEWAEDMLAKRKALEDSGAWAVEQDTLRPKNAEMRAWKEEAETSFSRCLFLLEAAPGEDKEELHAGSLPIKSITLDGTAIDFRGFIFPGTASFISAAFGGVAWFNSATFEGDARFASATFGGVAWFASATFEGDARFERATFEGDARFASATFEGITSFDSATFEGDARFASATFEGDARFERAIFKGAARFNSATFTGDASFHSGTFEGDAWFASATFEGVAWFNSATFTQGTSFRDARFGAEEKNADAHFTAIKVERAFDLSGASFSRVPSFCQADFKQAPDLDRVGFPLPSQWPWRFGDSALVPKYRAMRRMAIQGADYDREQMSFKGELRSRRWTTDKPWHPGLLLGILYDVFADCGRKCKDCFLHSNLTSSRYP